ncbi:ABC transporter substrate-binding protein [Polycladidibacter stylochi]|uniref:ABC transporter substrate-binding protein n=1 Tax=Polycladidibacter stylochi TaxID=1807766 RepID=UPI00082BF319|nr:extracellular solute-binding protein [Pseudovibrio stylochi]
MIDQKTQRGLTRRSMLTLTGGAALGALAAPSILRAETKIGGELYLETFGGSYAEAVTNIIVKPFEERYGVKVHISQFGNNAEVLAKLQAGNSRVDVSTLGGGEVYLAAKNKILRPLNLSNIPNFAQQHDKFRKPNYELGDTNNFSAGLVWGDRAIAYNFDSIDEAPTSWEALWDPRFAGISSAYLPFPGPIEIGALVLGQDMNNISDLDAIEKKLMELKGNLLKWWSSGSELTQLFAMGEVAISDFWRGRVNTMKEQGLPVDYVVPQEGAPSWVDTMVVPKTCQNVPAAEAFINTMLDAEIQRQFVLHGINYAPSNIETKLTENEKIRLGASENIFDTAIFADAAYVASQANDWNLVLNRLKS